MGDAFPYKLENFSLELGCQCWGSDGGRLQTNYSRKHFPSNLIYMVTLDINVEMDVKRDRRTSYGSNTALCATFMAR